ncbi:MAG: hypothetical protein RXP30_00440 [Thermoplasmata archaeon]|jgi:hypothetical protein|nr:hypothetical protein [Thermoplasmata archaeon]MVT13848.1 hypothetical protein [Euryarchaeota archaeon]MVT14105.1 hypothetical protein [Euryarchaeota archaeon]MVT35734.1 hypothetical protein [Euryarchaeota archaeon]
MIDLTIGTKCRVYIQADHEKIRENTGIFSGFINLGEESALVLEIEGLEGKYRLIPVASIVAIDIIEIAKQGEKREEIPSYFK